MQEDSPVPNMTVDALVENLPRWPFPKITAWEWNQVDSRQRRDRKQPPALGVPSLSPGSAFLGDWAVLRAGPSWCIPQATTPPLLLWPPPAVTKLCFVFGRSRGF